MPHHPIVSLVAAVTAAAGLAAQSPSAPVVTAIRNATIHPIDGPRIEKGTIVMEGGRIRAVGAAVPVPPGAVIVEATGLTALPGIVDAEGTSRATVTGVTGPMRAQLVAGDYFDPYGNDYRQERQLRDYVEWGVTSLTLKLGDSQVFDGVSSTVKVHAPGTYEDHFVRYRAALRVNLGEPPRSAADQFPSTRMGIAALVRQEFVKAQDYRRRHEEAAAKPDGDPPARDLKLDPLVAALKGELPVVVHAVEPMDVETAIRLADEFKVRLILSASTETLEAQIPAVLKRSIPVILGTYYSFINSHTGELTEFRYDTAARLSQAGVMVAFGGLSGESTLLTVNAGIAVQSGMAYDKALEALTINPARMLGIADRVGTLTPGKDADVVLFRGDPLEITSPVEQVWVSGRLVYERGPFDPTYHNMRPRRP